METPIPDSGSLTSKQALSNFALGPWLHAMTLDPDLNVLNTAKLISAAFPHSITLDAVVEYVERVFKLNIGSLAELAINSPEDKNLIEDFLRGWPINQLENERLRQFIALQVTPVVAFDFLLHALDFANPAPECVRVDARPKCPSQMAAPLQRNSMWHQLLQTTNKMYIQHKSLRQSAPETCAAPTVAETSADLKAEYLRFFSAFEEKHLAGDRTVGNIKQVSFVLGFYIKGTFEFNIDTVCAYSIAHAGRRGILLTEHEVKAKLKNVNVKRMIAPLWVALAHSPLLLLRDDASFVSKHWARPSTLFKIWQSSGNMHRHDSSHPLTIVECLLWRLFFRVALQEIEPAEALYSFFENGVVQGILSLDSEVCFPRALAYPADIIALSSAFLFHISAVADDDDESPLPLPCGPLPIDVSAPLPSFMPQPECFSIRAESPASSPPPDFTSAPSEFFDLADMLWSSTAGSSAQCSSPLLPDGGLMPSGAVSEGPSSRKRGATPIPLSSTTRSQLSDLRPISYREPAAPVLTKKAPSRKATEKSRVSPACSDSAIYYGPLENHLVYLYGPSSLLATGETERDRIDAALACGKRLCLTEERPVGPETVYFKTYCPAENPLDHPIYREHHWPVFRNALFDKTTAEEMLSTQIVDADGIPLHCQPSARNLDPNIKPGLDQSYVAVTTKAEFEMLSAQQQLEIHRYRCVLVLNTGSEPPPSFDRETLERFRDVDEDYPGLRTEDNEDITRVGRLSDLLDRTSRGGEPILNALQNPMENSNVPLPPGCHYATHERAANHTRSIHGLPPPRMPWEDLRWVIIATRNAKSAAHQDVLSTAISLLCGWKIWAIAVPADPGSGDGRGDFSSRDGFYTWDSASSNEKFLRWEFILLGPNMSFYMRAGTIHYVISLDDCVGIGLHGHCAAALSPGIWCALHNIITDSATTNADHATAMALFVRIMIFQARHLLCGNKTLHVPDLGEGKQVFDLVNLICFVILFTAFQSASYEHIEGDMLPMERDRFVELMHAWSLIIELITYIDNGLHFSSSVYDSFRELIDNSVTHMAACLVRYKIDWHDQVEHRVNFTPTTFQRQLGRALAAYESHWDTNGDAAKFDPLKPSDLRMFFLKKVASRKQSKYFLPWTADEIPCRIQPKDSHMGSASRPPSWSPESPSESGLQGMGKGKRKVSAGDEETPTKRRTRH